jgi:hypothetical protein
MRLLEKIEQWFWIGLLFISLSFSNVRLVGIPDRVRKYTQAVEFDGVSWTLDAAWVKLEQNALGMPYYIEPPARKQEVKDYLQLTDEIMQLESKITLIYTDPKVADPANESKQLREQLLQLNHRQDFIAPIAESVLQEQVSTVLAEQGLTTGGQPIPPVLYHATPLPFALIVSPRNIIKQDANILLLPDLTVETQIAIEDDVDKGLNMSTLVVPVGGIGAYPTMVMRTTDLNWLTEVISHEWTHNYLNLRPLGLNYDASPELRTMNETTASIAGKEIGSLVLRQFYPELASMLPGENQDVGHRFYKPDPNEFPRPPFDFRAQMHETRVTVDQLLAAGKINEAEAYMKQRRQIFWDHGYAIRKLNQAYFAFYGAYADVPGGAAGEDPVGPAVRALRAKSASLSDFINRIAEMSSFAELQAAVRSTDQ